MTFFTFITPVTYWILIVLWTYILFFYVKRLRGDLRGDKLLFSLFLILSIDAFRTLFESCYFGAWYTALAGFLPIEIHTFLVRPEMVFIPKIINVIAAVMVIFILLYRWIPHEVAAIRKLEKLVDERTIELTNEIKSRTEAEKNAKKYADNLEAIFNSTHNIFAIVNQEGRIDMMNHRGTDFVKKDRNEIIGRLGGEVFNCLNSFNDGGCGSNPECKDCPIRIQVLDTFETGKSFTDAKGEMTFLQDDDEKHFHLLISTSLLELDGQEKVLLSISDNTEQILAEKSIWESDQKFEKVFNGHLDSILLLNDEIPPQIMAVNKATKKVFGYQSDELIGKTTRLLHIDDAASRTFRESLLAAIDKSGYLDDFEFSMKRKDGTPFISEHRVVELQNDEGERTGWVSIIKDLTERKQTEEYLQQSQRMEAIGNLAGGIAHDFNNILFPIIGLAELLLEDLPPDSPDYENAKAIFTAGHRGSELVKQILTFSRQGKHETGPVKLQNVLKEVHKLTRATIPANIEFELDIQKDCGPVLGDPTQIHQIMVNFITNAYHAIEEVRAKGTIKIELKQIKGKEHGINKIALHNGECLLFKVSDDGSGIKKDVMKKLFEPYFTTKKQGKGTGLGLAVVFGIIKEYGGEITVHSRENEGSDFNVYLPLMSDDYDTETNNENLSEMLTGKERILLIDDEEPVLKLGKQMLERLGYQVTICKSSMEAVEKFKYAPDIFDLVISDYSMPYMRGDQLARELLIIKQEVPIIICTGFSEKVDESIIQSTGVRAILMKPFIKSDMGRTIRNVLDSEIREGNTLRTVS